MYDDPLDEHQAVAYIPATPENVAAMEDLLGRFRQLRVRLVELMAQEVIQQTLQNVDIGLPRLGNNGGESDRE